MFIPRNNGWRFAAVAHRQRSRSATEPIPRLVSKPPNALCPVRRCVSRTQRFRVEAGASACEGSLPPNNIEKTTKTDALGESSVTPNNGETSNRVFFEGFHAIVGPITQR